MDIQRRVKKIIADISKDLYEREETVAVSFLSALNGQSLFLYGPPGTAKSLIARRIAGAFKDSNYFEYLMQRFSTPEEVFGPVSLSELKKDNYLRKTDNYLPAADIAFLDEIWKSSPAILNTLLTIINERTFRNGAVIEKAPLRSLIAASNEFPEKNKGLDALYDRFIVRMKVEPVKKRSNFEAMITKSGKDEYIVSPQAFTKDEWDSVISGSANVTLSKDVLEIIDKIKILMDEHNKKNEIENTMIYVSDRRWQRAASLLRMSAYLNGRSEVIPVDTLMLRHCLWSSEENLPVISKIVDDAVLTCKINVSFNVSEMGEELVRMQDAVDALSDAKGTSEKNASVTDSMREKKMIDDKECFIYDLQIVHRDRPFDFRLYVPTIYVGTNEKFFPLNENGDMLKEFMCTFNFRETAIFYIDRGYKSFLGEKDMTEYRNGNFEKLTKKHVKAAEEVSAPNVPKMTRKEYDSYTEKIRSLRSKIDDALDVTKKDVAKQRSTIYTPFVPEDKRDILLTAMSRQIEELKSHSLEAERLQKKVGSFEISG
ncbi:MAG: AAA family ATPase [Methanomassiliicoccaceae archaeon]|nr:AAA family ATPase [Methanomassiliicoccaceae archaeon]